MHAHSHHCHFHFLVNHMSLSYFACPYLCHLQSKASSYFACLSLCHLQNKNRSYFACRYLCHLQGKTNYLSLNIICPCPYSTCPSLCHLQSKATRATRETRVYVEYARSQLLCSSANALDRWLLMLDRSSYALERTNMDLNTAFSCQ
jgi:hypothetical protein